MRQIDLTKDTKGTNVQGCGTRSSRVTVESVFFVAFVTFVKQEGARS